MSTPVTSAKLPAAIGEFAGNIRNLPFEVRALVASLQRPSAAARNRRKSDRHPFLYEIVIHVRNARSGGSQSVRCHTRDRNDTHVAFLTESVLPIGCEVVLDFTVCPETQVLGQVPARVRRCRQFVEGWFECVAHVGPEVRRELSSWERFSKWVGEFTGFGPDCRREAAAFVRNKKKSK